MRVCPEQFSVAWSKRAYTITHGCYTILILYGNQRQPPIAAIFAETESFLRWQCSVCGMARDAVDDIICQTHNTNFGENCRKLLVLLFRCQWRVFDWPNASLCHRRRKILRKIIWAVNAISYMSQSAFYSLRPILRKDFFILPSSSRKIRSKSLQRVWMGKFIHAQLHRKYYNVFWYADGIRFN